MRRGTITLTEDVRFAAPAKVDAANGVIAGVKIIGNESQNGRTYPPKTLAAAAKLYEGKRVNIDHSEKRPTQARSLNDRNTNKHVGGSSRGDSA